jgi:hypothetical protein
MVRIVSTLSVVALVLMAANFLVGLTGGDFNAEAQKVVAADRHAREVSVARSRRDPGVEEADVAAANEALLKARESYQPLRSRMTLHILLGVVAGLTVLLVNGLTITYFVGVSKWFREVVDAYSLDQKYATEGERIKRANFPWASSGMLAILILVFLGGAADASGANGLKAAAWVQPHYIAAMIAIVWIAIAFWQQSQKLAENQTLIREVMSLVQAARAKRGLPTEALEAARTDRATQTTPT